MFSQKVILSALAFFFMMVIVGLLYWYTADISIRASVYPQVVQVGQRIYVSDSTSGINKRQWDFGNRDKKLMPNKSRKKNDTISYSQAGTYLIRLTVNERMSKIFMVTILPLPKKKAPLHIEGPTSGYEGEKLTFRAVGGNPHKFLWRFGESQFVDAQEQTVVYSYPRFNLQDLNRKIAKKTFTIELLTDESNTPIKRTIDIYRAFYRFQLPANPLDFITNDIQQRLQGIANGEPFNGHYYHVLNRYLCKSPYTPVRLNALKENDFYSYCMGLHFDKGVRIDAVSIDADSVSHCVKKIYVTQHKL